MSEFLALSWQSADPSAAATAAQIVACVRRKPTWRVLVETRGKLVAATEATRYLLSGTPDQSTVVIGDLVDRHGDPCHQLPETGSFRSICQGVASTCWGGYVIVDNDDDAPLSVFRDPIGHCDIVTWNYAGATIVASNPMEWLDDFPPVAMGIDWDRVSVLLRQPALCFEHTPLQGVSTMPAGAITTFGGGVRHEERLWHPRQFYRRDRAGTSDLEELRDTAVRCVSAWQARHPISAVEVSGGFDSALVASVSARSTNRPRLGVTFYASDRAGDERRYAREVGCHSSLRIEEILVPVRPLTDTDLATMPIAIRPGLGSTSLFHDRQLADIAAGAAVTALFTGHGGDSVFFQHPTPIIAADPSFARTSLRKLDALAKWSGNSIWHVLWEAFALRQRRSRPATDGVMTVLPVARATGTAKSRWAGDTSGLPPAKRLHIEAIAGDRAAFGPSWCSAAVAVVHPLLSQPLVELTLGLDIAILTEGRRDRALARRAFAPLMPKAVVDRIGKGALTHFFGRMLARSAPFLRSYFLDGVLVREGMLDRARLEPMLTRDYLMRYDCYGDLLTALVLEHWLRRWCDRLAALPGRGACQGSDL